MYDLTVYKSFQVGGKQFVDQETISKGSIEAVEETVAIAWAGVLTTRTDDNTGTITMNDAGHLITTGAKVDIYWDDGTQIGVQRYSTVGTVSGTAVPIDLGVGDNLPTQTTAVIVCVIKKVTVSITGDDCAALLATADSTRAVVTLFSTGDTVEELAIVMAANGAYDWLSTTGSANPITGDTIDKVHMSIADVTNPRSVRFTALLDV